MASMTIRELDLELDAAAVVPLIRATNPIAVMSVPSFVHRELSVPERAEGRSFVAEVDGRVVGFAESFRSLFATDPGIVVVGVAVAETHRRRRIGAALYDTALDHALALDATQLLVHFHETADGRAFVERRGFTEVRAETEAALDPQRVSERPQGDVRPLSSIDPRLAYVIDMEATHDMPATEEFDAMPYDEWVGHVLDHPLLAPDGSFVVFDGGEAAALSLLTADRESGRAMSWMTGTRAAYRGRGLARQAKLASIAWAAANGITTMVTFNDETNAPMLAINRRLGYAPIGRRVEWLKAGTASSPAPPAPAT
jgi:GNAT superfamily N-acetyltransferase